MMGIYIKGMEMPKSCNECRFAVDGWCYAYPKQANGDALNRRMRTNWCPLIPVPPHGRLIDADALYEKIPINWHGDKQDIICTITGNDIKNAPTIIPAEEGEG